MSDGGLLEYILGNTEIEVKARNKYIAKLEREIMDYRRKETRKHLLDSIRPTSRFGS